MALTIVPLTLGAFDDLPKHLRQCVYWEVAPGAATLTDTAFDKEAWLSMLMLEWGSCGQIAIDHRPDGSSRLVGVAFYAPPRTVPRAATFPTAPVSPDAVLLTWVGAEPGVEDRVREELLTAVCTDLVRRGVRAVEAFGLLTPVGQTTESVVAQIDCGPCGCDTVPLTDADFLERMGFETVAPHHRYPRLRLELSEGLGWKAGVEHALEQLLAAGAAEAALREALEGTGDAAAPVCRAED
ncbi:acetyltransferase [Tsukamurella strandjordii]|uniref:Acetyltransferase n=1 Tax=Tsukamurella strandjordii TaxID=147577 RepID=A0AA90NBU1_9ACTN|nr:acetyltransferase [Tsukamurella strandjordii]MDP0399617.1 acetyltransferase [Tsukamurella strandjordii]